MKKLYKWLHVCIVAAMVSTSMACAAFAAGPADATKALDFMPVKGQEIVFTPADASGGGSIDTPVFNDDGTVNLKLAAGGWPAIKMDVNKKVNLNDFKNIYYSVEGTAKWNLIMEYEGAEGGDGKGKISISNDFFAVDELEALTGVQSVQGCFTWDGAPRTLPADGNITITTAKLFVVGEPGKELKVNYLFIGDEAKQAPADSNAGDTDTKTGDTNTTTENAGTSAGETNPSTGDNTNMVVFAMLAVSALGVMVARFSNVFVAEK